MQVYQQSEGLCIKRDWGGKVAAFMCLQHHGMNPLREELAAAAMQRTTYQETLGFSDNTGRGN